MELKFSNRTNFINEYYFSKKLEEVRELNKQGKRIINLGVGSPDLKPPQKVIDHTIYSFNQTTAHQYQSYRSIIELREELTKFYKTYYKCNLDAFTEVLPLIGSKEGIFYVSMTMLNEGDEVLVPNPGYPSYANATKLAGGVPISYNLDENNNWYPNLEELENIITEKTKLMWINYLNMPTGAMFDNVKIKQIIDFCKAHNIILCNDNPYSMILNNNIASVFSIDTDKECCIELNSMSKSFNMAGWRIGFLISNKTIIDNVLKIKSNVDSGMFLPLQIGAIKALESTPEWFVENNTTYINRRELLFKLLDKIGFSYNKDNGGMFVWAKINDKYKDANEASDDMLYNAGIFITPGNVFGSNGKNYVRLSLCCNTKIIKEAIERINILLNK